MAFQVRPVSDELEASECNNLDVVTEFSEGLDAVVCSPDVHFIRFGFFPALLILS